MRWLLVVVQLGSLLLAGCSSHLTRSRAKTELDQLVKRNLERGQDSPHALLFQIGLVSSGCDESLNDFDPVESGAEYPMLAATGYLTVTPVRKHVWRVELTDLGKKSIAGQPYAHKQNGTDCDQWQVTLPLAKFDHVEVTGVLEEGVHAKVQIAAVFTITQVGLDARKVAEKYVFE